MKKILFLSFFIIFTFVIVLVLRAFLPKYSGMLMFFFFFMLFDGYLWFSVHTGIKRLSSALLALAAFLFWLPVAIVLCILISGFFVSFLDWNLPFRVYLQSFIMVLFLTEVIPIITLTLADFVRLMRFTFTNLILKRRTRLKSIPRFKPLLITGWIMGLIIFSGLMAGTIFWQFDFVVTRQVISLPELPRAFNGVKIVQISDIHLGSWGSKRSLQEAMDKINRLHPDLIFFTGDMFNYCTADGKGFTEILKTLRAHLGIYTILGNHDYGDYISWPTEEAKARNMEELKAFYKTLGWKLLLNSNDILKIGTDSIAVIGVENWGATRRFQKFGDIAVAQKGTETMAIQLLLSHDPSHWDSIVSKKYQKIDVTFSGHTHGGQVGINCCNIHWSPVVWASRLWCGLYKNPNSATPQYLYVNQGLGNIGYSGRIGILPEITLFTLQRN